MTKSNVQKRAVARGKKFEQEVAKTLKPFGAKRVWRMGNWAVSEPDIIFEGLFHWLNIDCKKYAKMKHHSLFRETTEKYASDKNQTSILATQEKGKSETLYVIPEQMFIHMLQLWYEHNKNKNVRFIP